MPPIDPLPLPPAGAQSWLFDQSPVVVVCLLFILTLLWILKLCFGRIRELEKRSDELSVSLQDLVRSTSQERADRATNQMLSHESILRTTLASLESALLTRLRE